MKNKEDKPEEISEIRELRKKIETCEREREEYLNGWKRAKADFINYQKDEAKRFEEIIKFSNRDLIKDLIIVLDSFDLAMVVLEKIGKIEKGVYMIRSQLEDTLKKWGLERVAVSINQPFDPALQEALKEVESDKPPGTVVEEVERGYLLNGRLIRPAKVKVSKQK